MTKQLSTRTLAVIAEAAQDGGSRGHLPICSKLFLITALPSVTKYLKQASNSASFQEVVSMACNVVQFQKGLS